MPRPITAAWLVMPAAFASTRPGRMTYANILGDLLSRRTQNYISRRVRAGFGLIGVEPRLLPVAAPGLQPIGRADQSPFRRG